MGTFLESYTETKKIRRKIADAGGVGMRVVYPAANITYVPEYIFPLRQSYLLLVCEQYRVVRCGHFQVGKNSSCDGRNLWQDSMIHEQVIN